MPGRFGVIGLFAQSLSRPPTCAARASFSSASGPQRKSPHAEWYSQILPSMLPIALLGSSVYLGLHLIQTNLARERYADHAGARIEALENELTILRRRQKNVSDTSKEGPYGPIRRWWFF